MLFRSRVSGGVHVLAARLVLSAARGLGYNAAPAPHLAAAFGAGGAVEGEYYAAAVWDALLSPLHRRPAPRARRLLHGDAVHGHADARGAHARQRSDDAGRGELPAVLRRGDGGGADGELWGWGLMT